MRYRLVPCIFLKNGVIVRSENFKVHQVIGNPINQVRRFSEWAVDEIIYIEESPVRVTGKRIKWADEVELESVKFFKLTDLPTTDGLSKC